MALLRLGFRVALDLLELINSGLEFQTRLVEIFFGLITLLLQESVATLPESFLFIENIHLILQLALHFLALLSRPFQLSSNLLRVGG